MLTSCQDSSCEHSPGVKHNHQINRYYHDYLEYKWYIFRIHSAALHILSSVIFSLFLATFICTWYSMIRKEGSRSNCRSQQYKDNWQRALNCPSLLVCASREKLWNVIAVKVWKEICLAAPNCTARSIEQLVIDSVATIYGSLKVEAIGLV